MGVTFWAWPNVAFHFHMAHPVVNVTEEQAAAAIAGLDPDKEPYVLVCILDQLARGSLLFRVRCCSGP